MAVKLHRPEHVTVSDIYSVLSIPHLLSHVTLGRSSRVMFPTVELRYLIGWWMISFAVMSPLLTAESGPREDSTGRKAGGHEG